MAIEAIKGASMSYTGSSSAAGVNQSASVKVENAANASTSDTLAKQTTAITANETEKQGADTAADENASNQTLFNNTQIQQAVDEINKSASNSEAVFGIHDKTNRVTIKIIDKDTKEVIKEYPPEKTLDMIAKVWEMAGLLVDQKL